MKIHLSKQTIINEFRPVIQEYIRRAKDLDMKPIELALQIGGPAVDTDFLDSWEDAEQEIAYSWLRQMDGQVH